MASITSGKLVEAAARSYLELQGLKFITANYQCRSGEVDLVMRDDDTVVFVEVRYRRSSHYGGGLESVNGYKQRKVILAAAHYLQRQNLYDKVACRFDVVAVSGIDKYDFEWVRDAFWANW